MASWFTKQKWSDRIVIVICMPFVFVFCTIAMIPLLAIYILASPFLVVIGIWTRRKYIRGLAKSNRLVDWPAAKQMAMDGECVLFFQVAHSGRQDLWCVRRAVCGVGYFSRGYFGGLASESG